MAEAEQPPPRRSGRAVRCAIYTRKSTEEGLDQAFNSLDAQREACEAFILSQRHEGWTRLKRAMTAACQWDHHGFAAAVTSPGIVTALLLSSRSGA